MRIGKLWILAIIISLSAAAFGQVIDAQKEILASIVIGNNENELSYDFNEEGLFGPSGPFVNDRGTLFFIDTTNYTRLQKLENGTFGDMPFPEGWPEESIGLPAYRFRSQQGSTQSGSAVFVFDEKFFRDSLSDAIGLSKFADLGEENIYPTKWGYFVEFSRFMKKALFSLEKIDSGSYRVRDTNETRSWLLERNDGFSIGVDDKIYNASFCWSAILPIEIKSFSYSYLGRLASGHVLWISGRLGMEKILKISTPCGQIELTLELPWAPSSSSKPYQPFTYCLGPWGEIYALIAPSINENAWPPKDSFSDLIVVRNHLQYFGRLIDGNVRLRQNPSTSADILGIYPAKTGFRIIEKSTEQETIGGKADYWYHVRLLDGKEGWFFGSFVAKLYDGPGTPPPWPNVPDW
jgi:hypothetical protein